MASCTNKRRFTDVMKLMSEFKVVLVDEIEFRKFNVEFHGPKDSPYEGGVWEINVELSDEYPFYPPSILFGSKIYHPNINETLGLICLDVLYKKWNTVFDLVIIFEMFLPQLLLHPNPEDPVNSPAAALLMADKPAFDQTVKDYVKRFATPGVVKTADDEDGNPLDKSVDPMAEQSGGKSVDPMAEQSGGKSDDGDGKSLDKSVDTMVERFEDLPPVGEFEDLPPVGQFDDFFTPVGKCDESSSSSKPT